MTYKYEHLELVNGMPEPLDGNKYEVHVSDIRSFMKCRLQWRWSSPLGLHLEPKAPNLFFFLGHLIHDALEVYHSGNTDDLMEAISISKAYNWERVMADQEGVWDFEVEKYAGQMVLAEDMFYNYSLWIKEKNLEGAPYADSNLEYISTETNWEIPAITPKGRKSPRIYFAGRFDGLVRRVDTGELWLFETKTSQNPTGLIRSLQNDNQATMYMMAANVIMDEPVVGVLYNIILKRSPKMPKELKSGRLSENKRAGTTYELFMETARQTHVGYTSSDIRRMYGDYIEHLKGQSPYVQRVFIRRPEAHVSLFRREAHKIALEMVNPSTAIYPNPTPLNCGWCKFWDVCTARYRGEKPDPYLEMDFQERDSWQSIDVEQLRGVMG